MASLMASRIVQLRPVIVSLRKASSKSCLFRPICTSLQQASVKLNLLDAGENKAKLYSCRNFKSWAEDRKRLTVEKIQERVMNIVHQHDKIDKNKVTLESHFMNDLGLDSLDHIEIIMAIEDEFMFQIKDVDAEKLFRPIDIVNFVKKKDDDWTEPMDDSELPR